MAGMICDVCGGRVVATGSAYWFVCEYCGVEYPLEWMQAKFQRQEVWRAQGRCGHCGGNLGWFSDRCRDCGMQN